MTDHEALYLDTLTCACDQTPRAYDDPESGPAQDCPLHGDVRLFATLFFAERAENRRLRERIPLIAAQLTPLVGEDTS